MFNKKKGSLCCRLFVGLFIFISGGLSLGTQVAHAAPPLADAAKTIENIGITPSLFTWEIFADNASVGPRPGEASLSTNVAAGLDFDLDKLVGIPGGTFHLQYIFFPANQNDNATTANGQYFGAAGSYYAGLTQSDISKGYLAQFNYEQKLFNNLLDIKVGRFSAGVDIYHKGTMDCMIKVDCADPVFEDSSGTLPPPYGSWASLVTVNFNDRFYVKGGIFQLDLNQYLKKGNGFDWAWNKSLANNIDFEAGYDTTNLQVPYPAHYWATFFRNTYGLTSDDGSGQHAAGTNGYMLNGRQMVWKTGAGGPNSPSPQSLWVFGSYSGLINPDTVLSLQQRPFKHAAEIGASYIGLFGRPMDDLSLAIDVSQLDDRYYQFIKQKVPDAKATSVAIRAKYDFMLPQGFFIEPGVEYIVQPDDTRNAYGYFRPSATHQLPNGWMVRFMIGWNIGQALGF